MLMGKEVNVNNICIILSNLLIYILYVIKLKIFTYLYIKYSIDF